MKLLLLAALFLSVSSWGAAPSPELEATAGNEQLMLDNPAITHEQMNTSPNPAPNSEEDIIRNSTLSNKPIEKNSKNLPGKQEIQAQEDAMDYSTTPRKQPARSKRNSGVDQDNIGH